MRAVLLSGLMLAAVTVGGCQTIFSPIQPEARNPVDQLDRAEVARERANRNHPACRSDRSDRDDQPEGCDVVVRRGQ